MPDEPGTGSNQQPAPLTTAPGVPSTPSSSIAGGTQSSVLGPSVATRGSVQKTFISARFLSGFTDAPHFEQLTGEYQMTLDSIRRQRLLDSADASRRFVSALPQLLPAPAILRPIATPYVNAIQSDPLFQQSFGARQYQFAIVDMRQVVAVQTWVEPRSDRVPSDDAELAAFALPNNWDVPAEISFIPPMGPIQILSSSPMFSGLQMEFDPVAGAVKLSPPKHLNLVQVMHFAGRFYLLNGYHRVTDALAAGIFEIPAIVTQASQPQDFQLGGVGPFNAAWVQTLPRPPLVADFNTPAALDAKIRERRYGAIVDVTMKPLMLGI